MASIIGLSKKESDHCLPESCASNSILFIENGVYLNVFLAMIVIYFIYVLFNL